MDVATIRQSVAQAVAAPQQKQALHPAMRLAAVMLPLAAALAALAALVTLNASPVGAKETYSRVISKVIPVSHPGVVERDDWVRQGPIEVSVRVQGNTAPLFHASSRPDRWYLEAREGAKYEVRVRNVTGERVAFLIAVDGLNAINGQVSALSSHEPMYVLDPWANATIKGWRKDMKNVSRFVFVDEERSYAERTGQGNGDLGWIRVLAFHEDEPYIAYRQRLDRDEEMSRENAKDKAAGPPAEGRLGDRSQAPQSAPAPLGEASPGTGWGGNERDPVRRVDFQPQSFASAQVILRYEYRGALTAMGILPWRAPSRDRLWERENGLYGFAQPPRR